MALTNFTAVLECSMNLSQMFQNAKIVFGFAILVGVATMGNSQDTSIYDSDTTTPGYSVGSARATGNYTSANSYGTTSHYTTPNYGTASTYATPSYGTASTYATPSYGTASTYATPNYGTASTYATPSYGTASGSTTADYGATSGSDSGQIYNPHKITLNAYGLGVNSDEYGRPQTWRTDDGKQLDPIFQGGVKQDAYGLGVGMDQFGRPVHSDPQ